MTRGYRRPLGITALIIFFAAGTLLSFVAGLSLLIPWAFFNAMWQLNPRGHGGLLRLGIWGVVLMLAASAACGSAAVGLWRRTRWGHFLAVTLIAINLLSDLINALLGVEPKAIIGVPIAVGILIYLLSRRVREYFVP